MLAAVIQIHGWMGIQSEYIEGAKVTTIIKKFEKIQDLHCLASMGRMQENAAGQKEVDKLEDFLVKVDTGKATADDLRNLQVQLSIGAISCAAVAETPEEIAELKAQYK